MKKLIDWLKNLWNRRKNVKENVEVETVTPPYTFPIISDKQLTIIPRPLTYHRSRKREVSGIILHSMREYIEYVGKYVHYHDYLEAVKLSAHYFVEVNGDVINSVHPERCAYHAGKSKIGDEINLNESFIGVELIIKDEGNYGDFLKKIKDPQYFHDIQYENMAKLCVKLMDRYNISIDRVVSHHEVSGIDVRPDPKRDIGSGFDLDRFYRLIDKYSDLTLN